MTLQQHLQVNAARIEAEAREYAQTYRMPLEQARREVADEYAQGWHEERDNARYEALPHPGDYCERLY